MTVKITIADYGVGNLLNVARAFQHCGADVHIRCAEPIALSSVDWPFSL